MDSKIKARLREFILNGETEKALAFLNAVETTNSPRTGAQNAAMHVWFEQVAQTCRENSVDAKMVMGRTVRMDMTAAFIKEMWRALQTALYKKQSTTQLNKTGEIDRLYDHFIRFFADEFELELPPFPSNSVKQLENLGGYKSKAGQGTEGYDDNYKEPLI